MLLTTGGHEPADSVTLVLRMQTAEFLAGQGLAVRELGTLRWGISLATPRVAAELLTQPRTASKIARRLVDEGAEPLLRALVEQAGGPVPRNLALLGQAQVIADRLLLIEAPSGWQIPSDLALAWLRLAERELLHLQTLLGRCEHAALRRLAAELSVDARRSRLELVAAIADAVIAVDSPEHRDAARATESLASLPVSAIRSVEPVAGSAGCRFRVEAGDEVWIVAPREIAIQLGARVAAPVVNAATPSPPAAATPREPQLELPPHARVGALISFASPRAMDDAMRVAEFRNLVARRLDDRRVVTRPEVFADDVLAVLTAAGFGESA